MCSLPTALKLSPMRVEAVLFDADGVVQRPTADRQAQWKALLGGPDEAVGRFKCDIFAAERPCHDGAGDFLPALREVLDRWNCAGSLDDALRAWTAIEVDRAITGMIASVRASGIPCHLASNQEPYRARHMSDVLDYRNVFDRLFYSCDLGCSKPDPGYFTAILDSLSLPSEAVLFIDDKEANVAAAARVGIHAELFAPELATGAAEEMQRILSRYGITVGPAPCRLN
jgi:putative hydrolase of the HAD superfamily